MSKQLYQVLLAGMKIEHDNMVMTKYKKTHATTDCLPFLSLCMTKNVEICIVLGVFGLTTDESNKSLFACQSILELFEIPMDYLKPNLLLMSTLTVLTDNGYLCGAVDG